MSVRTSAQENRDDAKKDINDAIKQLSEIVIDEIYGWDEFTSEYLETLKDILFKLLEIKKELE